MAASVPPGQIPGCPASQSEAFSSTPHQAKPALYGSKRTVTAESMWIKHLQPGKFRNYLYIHRHVPPATGPPRYRGRGAHGARRKLGLCGH